MLSHLHLRNVKNFQEADVPLGPVTVLVGANAAGKSNLRDALRFLHGVGRGYELAEVVEGKRGDGGEMMWRGLRGGTAHFPYRGTQQVVVEATLGGDPGLRYKVSVTSGRRDSLFTPLHLRTERLEREDGTVVFDLPPDGPARVQGGETGVENEFDRTTTVLSQMARAHAPPDADVQAAIDTCRAAASALRAMRFLNLDPRALRQRSTVGQTTLGDRGQHLASVLLEVCDDPAVKADVVDWVAALTPMDARDLRFSVAEYSNEVTLVLIEADGTETPMQGASDGTLRFLALLALLYQDDPPGLVFVEEIETGLHPSRLPLLADLLETRAEATGTQVVATTHAQAVLDALSPDARADALKVYRTGDGPAAKVRPLAAGADEAASEKSSGEPNGGANGE